MQSLQDMQQQLIRVVARVRVGADGAGAAIEVEVWALDAAAFGSFVDEVPAPLVIERVTTAVDVVTRLPLASTTSATGWVEKATPLVAPVG